MRSINRIQQLFESAKLALETPVAPGETRVQERAAVETSDFISRLFRDFRSALGLSINQIALRLDTDPGVILALEMGQFGALPPWPETKRVVTAYTAMADIDARPVLSALHEQIGFAAAISVDYTELEVRDRRHPIAAIAASFLARVQQRSHTAIVYALHVLKQIGAHWVRAARMMADHYGPAARDFSLSAYLIAVLPVFGMLVFVMASLGAFEARSSEPVPPPHPAPAQAGNVAEIKKFFAFGGPVWIETEDPRDLRTDKLQLSRQ